jgi:hypothetical protein
MSCRLSITSSTKTWLSEKPRPKNCWPRSLRSSFVTDRYGREAIKRVVVDKDGKEQLVSI